ncbi:MAG TPA: TlpA disulfide reductase family protein [Egibacteraceae bacterium]|nr:TlpA disulfide reductase family protein [Egibacteraceae bacterium]
MLVGVAATLALLAAAAAVALLTRPDPLGGSAAPATAGLGPDLRSRPAAADRFALPDVVLAGFAGAPPVRLADYRGTPLVVNFWASWCTPCVVEMPDFQQVAGEVAGRAEFLGVNVQDAPASAAAFVTRLGIDYDLASDPAGEFYAEVRNFGMPTTLFVDPAGTVAYRHTGALDASQLRELLAVHLGVQAGAGG